MSRFGGPAAKASVTMSEVFHGNIEAPVVKGDYKNPSRVNVRLNEGNVLLQNVIYGRPLDGQPVQRLIGKSVQVSKIGGRWAIL